MRYSGTGFRVIALATLTALLVTVGVIIPPARSADAQVAPGSTTRTVASPATDGSLALNADGMPLIGYTTLRVVGDDVEPSGVKAAQCVDVACTSKTVVLRDSAGIGSARVAFDSDGRPMMAYVRAGDSGEVWVARCDTPACATSTSSKVADGEGPLDLVLDANDNPIIVFQLDKELRLAHCYGAGCASPTNVVIDTLGKLASVALPSNGNPVIMYKSRTPRRTKIAVCADANCESIANRNEVDRTHSGRSTSLAIGSNDLPFAAVDDADGGMKDVYCEDALCASIVVSGYGYVGAENAALAVNEFGDEVIAFASDRPSILRGVEDTQSFQADAVFEQPDVAVDASGRPSILYQATNNRLRLVSCSDTYCGDSLLETESLYHLKNVATGEYLDPTSDRSAVMSSTPTKRTRFLLREARPNVYWLAPTDFGTYLEADGAALDQVSNRGRRSVQWRIQRNNDGSHTVQAIGSGASMVAADGGPALEIDPEAQDRWEFVPAAGLFTYNGPLRNKRVTLQNVATGRWLDADANGRVEQSRNQQADDVWTVFGAQYDYVVLRNDVHRGYLDADRDDTDVRTSGTEGLDDRWDLVEVEEGVFTLRNVRFGGYLSADGAAAGFNASRSSTVSETEHWRIVILDE